MEGVAVLEVAAELAGVARDLGLRGNLGAGRRRGRDQDRQEIDAEREAEGEGQRVGDRQEQGLHGGLVGWPPPALRADFSRSSFDDAVGPRQYGRRNRHADGFRGPCVDDEFELGRLLHRQVCGLRTLENSVHKDGAASKQVGEVGSVRHQEAAVRPSAVAADRGDALLRRQSGDPVELRAERRIADDEQAPQSLLVDRRERLVHVDRPRAFHAHGDDRQLQRSRRTLGESELRCGGGVAGIPEDADLRRRRHHLLQKFQSLRQQLRMRVREPGDVGAGTAEARHELRADRIRLADEHDGNRARRLPGRRGAARGCGDDEVDLRVHELVGELGQHVDPASRIALLDDEVAAFGVALLQEALAQRCEPRPGRRVGTEGQVSDAPRPRFLRHALDRQDDEGHAERDDRAPDVHRTVSRTRLARADAVAGARRREREFGIASVLERYRVTEPSHSLASPRSAKTSFEKRAAPTNDQSLD